MTTITTTLKAYIPGSYPTIEALNKMLADDPDRAAAWLAYTSSDMSDRGWTFVGTGRITIDFISVHEITQRKVEAIKAQIDLIREDASEHIRKLEDQLKSLLALDVK